MGRAKASTTSPPPGEFALIEAITEALGPVAQGEGVVLGPGDDAAVLAVPAQHELVVSTDTLVAGRHYPPAAAPANIGYRSMAAATSDLAAMGAAPAWALVSLTAPDLAGEWATAFAAGIRAAAEAFGLKVVGGNLARGPASVTIAVHGHVPAGTALRRSGAKPGDRVYVSGHIGGAGLALADAPALAACPAEAPPGSALARYWRPQPRLALGMGLRGIATAAIDVSDGLAAEVDHLCQASQVQAVLSLAKVPLFPGAVAEAAIGAGDDYDLVFTAPAGKAEAVAGLAQTTGVPLTAIGTMVAEQPWRGCWDAGLEAETARGYRHF